MHFASMRARITRSVSRHARRPGIKAPGAVLALAALAIAFNSAAAEDHRSTKFEGVKANTGFVTHHVEGGEVRLTLSDDFVVPDAPDPHWQVVDAEGNVYLLQRLVVKPDRINRTIVLPPYVPNVVKVQMWCAFVEVLLGEASFDKPLGK